MIYKKASLFVLFSLALVNSGCFLLPLTGYGRSHEALTGEILAEYTLDIGSSSPDLIISSSYTNILKLLGELGADEDFPEKTKYKNRMASIYFREGVIGREDEVFLYHDGIEGWMNVIVVKKSGKETLLWFRKPTCCGYEPPADGAYHKDWLSITRNACIARGIPVR